MELKIDRELILKYFAKNIKLIKELFDRQKLCLERNGWTENGDYKYNIFVNNVCFDYVEKIGAQQLSKKNAPEKFLKGLANILREYVIVNNIAKYDFLPIAQDYMSVKNSKIRWDKMLEIKAGLSLALKNYELDLLEQTLRG